jgi:hypothetical protein
MINKVIQAVHFKERTIKKNLKKNELFIKFLIFLIIISLGVFHALYHKEIFY